MERNVVTLSTAKKLKAAGFPQDSIYYWYEKRGLVLPKTRPAGRDVFAAPTAQEIADQLPKQCSANMMYTSGAEATYMQTKPWIRATGSNLAEALAELWLKLQDTH